MSTLTNKNQLFSFLLLFSFCLVAPSLILVDSNFLDNHTITLRVETDRTGYLQGETVKIYVYVVNWMDTPIDYPTVISYSVVGVRCLVHITWPYPPPTFPPNSETLFDSFHWSTIDSNGRKRAVGTYTMIVQVEGVKMMITTETTIRIYRNLDIYLRPMWGFY